MSDSEASQLEYPLSDPQPTRSINRFATGNSANRNFIALG